MGLWELFQLEEKREKHGKLFSELESMLASYNEEEKKFFTGFAGLLGSVAYSDQVFSDEEAVRLEEILRTQTSLPEDKVATTVKIIKNLTEDLAGIEDYRYTRAINSAADKKSRLEVLACLYRIASADNSISSEEDHRIKIIADNLMLTADERIQVREKFLTHLEVLKNMPD